MKITEAVQAIHANNQRIERLNAEIRDLERQRCSLSDENAELRAALGQQLSPGEYLFFDAELPFLVRVKESGAAILSQLQPLPDRELAPREPEEWERDADALQDIPL